MSAAATPVTRVTPAGTARSDRMFHTGMAIAFLVTALVGFGPTYFLKPVHSSPPLSGVLHLHAAVFTGWLVLLLVQSALVRAHRVDLHMRLGLASVVLAAAMILLGIMAAIDAARRGVQASGATPLAFMVFPVGAIVMFAGFFGAALWKRRKPELHRRLIIFATVSIITPAIARLPYAGRTPVLALLLSLLFVVAMIIHDWKARGRVHALTLAGGAIVLLSGPVRAAIGNSAAWQSFAHFLVG